MTTTKNEHKVTRVGNDMISIHPPKDHTLQKYLCALGIFLAGFAFLHVISALYN